ncbi:MAG: hypothetical protein V4627_09085 [Pseudomonadota bacterium]
MNQHTPQVMQFVLYSTQELVSGDGAGFWSNADGWVEFKAATRFTLSSVPTCNLPITEGQDAKWIMWESEGSTVPRGSGQPVQISLPLTTH